MQKKYTFRNENEGILSGDGGLIRKTTNGGLNWNQVNIPLDVQYDLWSLTFSDSNTGWVVSPTRRVFKTTDFGSNWDSISRIPHINNNSIISANFPTNSTGYAGGSGVVFKTTNGGLNWTKENAPFSGFITFINSQTGWICSGQGRIAHTTT